MTLFFLFNASRRRRAGAWREDALRQAKRFGWTAQIGEIDRADPQSGARLVEQALASGATRMVLAGGDGTLHRVINLLAARRALGSTELAVIPAGTCNDFARFQGLSRHRWARAFEIACAGTPRPVDLGEMNGELFLNNAGFGRRPRGAAARGAARLNPLRSLQNFQPTVLRAAWDQGSVEGAYFMGLACNAPFFSGGLHFSTQVSLQDGLLDIYLVPAMPKWRLVPVLAMGRLGRATRFKGLVTLRTARLEVEAQSDLWPQADGEPAPGPTRRVLFAVSREKAIILTG